MYKYINIKAILNYIPSGLLEEESEPELIKYAVQGYTNNVQNIHVQQEIKFAICELKDHKVILPLGVKKILDASYTQNKPYPDNSLDISENTTVYLRTDWNGNTITIFQALVYNDIRPLTEGMRFTGQNSDLVHNQCKNLLCNNCINFSIDRSLATMTVDKKDGYVYILYTCPIQDDNENFLIPDDGNLKQALAYYVEARHWQDRAFRKEENADNMFEKRMMNANFQFDEFNNRHILRSLEPGKFVFNTQTINRIPQIIYQKSKNYYQ